MYIMNACTHLHVRFDDQVDHLDWQLGARAGEESVAVGRRARGEKAARARIALQLLPDL